MVRMASTLADAGDLGLPELPALRCAHATLADRLGLDLEVLQGELLSYEDLTLGVDQLLA
jgi:hypothetical protein